MSRIDVSAGRGRAALRPFLLLLLVSGARCTAPEEGPTAAVAQADHRRHDFHGHHGHHGAAPVIDVSRTLAITDLPTLESIDDAGNQRFSFERVLGTLASTSGDGSIGALDLYQILFDNDNDAAHAVLPGAHHCDDETDDTGYPTLNGFRIECPRQEGRLADVSKHDPFHSCAQGCEPYSPIAITSRLDLADPGGQTCGQFRIVFGKGVGQAPVETAGITDITNRLLMIFEAIIPNINPDQGLQGCVPYIEKWAALSSMDDPADRGRALDEIFFDGVAGFPPVVQFDHYTGAVDPDTGVQVGGQIRTNQFMFDQLMDSAGDIGGMPWQLHEYHTKLACHGHGRHHACGAEIRAATVNQNPDAALFNDNDNSPRAKRFRNPRNPAGFIAQIPGLIAGDLNLINISTLDREFFNGQSTSSPSLILPAQNNPFPVNGPFPAPLNDSNYNVVYMANARAKGPLTRAIQKELDRLGSSLTPEQVVRRAQTQACAGCHMLATSQAALFGGIGDPLPPPPADQVLPPAVANQLGDGLVWPDAANSISPVQPGAFINSFTQTSEELLVPLPGTTGVTCDVSCTKDPRSCQCSWQLSPALTDVFLPFRKKGMEDLLQDTWGSDDGSYQGR